MGDEHYRYKTTNEPITPLDLLLASAPDHPFSPPGKPDAPSNCTVANQTSTGFAVACRAEFDGGLRQVSRGETGEAQG